MVVHIVLIREATLRKQDFSDFSCLILSPDEQEVAHSYSMLSNHIHTFYNFTCDLQLVIIPRGDMSPNMKMTLLGESAKITFCILHDSTYEILLPKSYGKY